MQNRSIMELPETVKIADKPPLLGGIIKTISVTEFEKLAHFKWTESLIPTSNASLHVGNFSSLSEANSIKMLNQIRTNYQRMAICYMNEKIDYGVFATEEIPANSYVSFYSGQFCYENDIDSGFENSQYNLKTEIIYKKGNVQVDTDGYINAEHMGNISRFFQHLPSGMSSGTVRGLSCFNNYQLNSSEDVAIENLKISSANLQGLPLLLFQAACTIKQGQQIGFDYSIFYWMSCNVSPSLFHMNGSIINSCLYNVKKVFLYLKINDQLNYGLTSDKEDILTTQDELKEITPGFAIPIQTLAESIKGNPNSLFCQIDCAAQLRFFKSKAEVVCKILNSITSHLGLFMWQFNEKTNVAFHECENDSISLLNVLIIHAKKFNLNAEIKNENDKLILVVHNPTPVQLINLREFSVNKNKEAKFNR